MPFEILSIIIRNRYSLENIEKDLISYGLENISTWKYDPLHISQLRKKVGVYSYVHMSNPKIEKFVNINTWPKNNDKQTSIQMSK